MNGWLRDIPPELWPSLWLTLRLATTATLILLAIAVPLAWWLNNSRNWMRTPAELLVTLPIVLPPTVIGFYLLIALSPSHFPGNLWADLFGKPLPFSFWGLVVGSVFYSLPFAVQPIQSAFRSVPAHIIEAAVSLGANQHQTFYRIVVPYSRHGILTGAALSFAHTMGEFGVVLMLGGNIPGSTRVASIALYDEVQQLNYRAGHIFAIALLLVSLALLGIIGRLQRKGEQQRPQFYR